MFGFRDRERGTAVLHAGGELDFPAFNALLDSARRRLQACGARPGDRVATLLPNSLELLVAYYACLMEGLVVVPLSVRLSAREISDVLAHSGSRLVLVNADTSKRVPTTGGDVVPEPLLFDILPRRKLYVGAPPMEIPAWPEGHPAVLYYTSGSTGRPKGVLYTHGTLTRNCEVYGGGLGISESDRVVLCHCMASNFVFAQLTVPFLEAGATVQVADFGSVAQTLEAIRDGATFLSLIPWLGYRLVDAARPGDLAGNRLRVAQVGGDGVPPDYFRCFRAAFGIAPRQMIGMTETNTYATNPMVEGDLRLESCGRPLPGVAIEVRDAGGWPLPTGEQGEIWVRTPAAMAGYWRDPGLTHQTVVGGWVRTGDAGRLDGDGYLWFSGRIKHVIVCDGDNIHPREVEIEIMRHPDVRWACVFGVPEPRRGQVIAAAVVLKPSRRDLPLQELRGFLADRLAMEKVPSQLRVLEAFPHSRVGKLDRAALLDGCRTFALPETG